MKISKTSPLSVAEEYLPASTMSRNLPGMVSPTPAGPNLYDSGAASKPQVNTQPYNNAVMTGQNETQNVLSAAPQAAAGAMRQVGMQATEESGAVSKAQQFKDARTAEVIYANQATLSGDGGRSAMEYLGNMSPVDKQIMDNNIAVSQALGNALNPDLGAYAADAARYS